MEVQGGPWTSMALHGGPWTSMEVHGPPRRSMEVQGGPGTSMDLHGGPWTSMEVQGGPWISMDIHGSPWIFVDFRGFSWIFVDFRGNPLKSVENFDRRSNWLKIAKNNFLHFLPFYPLRSAFQALSCLANDRSRRDLSIGIENSSFHAVWLGIEPFLCFIWISCRPGLRTRPCLGHLWYAANVMDPLLGAFAGVIHPYIRKPSPPRPLASRRVDALTEQQTLQTSQNLQTNLLGGGFTLPLPPPRRSGPLRCSFSWRPRAPLGQAKNVGKMCICCL